MRVQFRPQYPSRGPSRPVRRCLGTLSALEGRRRVVAIVIVRVDFRTVSARHLVRVVEVDRSSSDRAGASSAAVGHGARALEHRAVKRQCQLA